MRTFIEVADVSPNVHHSLAGWGGAAALPGRERPGEEPLIALSAFPIFFMVTSGYLLRWVQQGTTDDYCGAHTRP